MVLLFLYSCYDNFCTKTDTGDKPKYCTLPKNTEKQQNSNTNKNTKKQLK